MCKTSSVVEAAARLQNALESNSIEHLTPSDFRVFIDCSRKVTEIDNKVLERSSKILLSVLKSGQLYNDCQIVVATAYVSVITRLKQESEEIFQHFLSLLNQNKGHRYKIFICYATLQLNNKHWSLESRSKDLFVKEVFNLVQDLCCELRPTTFLTFKVFYILLCKIHLIHPDGKGVSSDDFSVMLKIVMSNWENPLSGIRQQNSLVFSQMLLFDKTLWDAVLPKPGLHIEASSNVHNQLITLILSNIPWLLKSKYFLLTIILQKIQISQMFDSFGEDIVQGLLYSLTVPNLVSAGADLYRTVLMALSPTKWQHWFLKPFIELLTQSKLSLGLENLFDYWMHHTVKQITGAYDELIKCRSLNIFSYLCLKTIARKEGYPDSDWESVDQMKIKSAIEDYCDSYRSQGFYLVCVSSKTSTPPSKEEFDIIQQFLRQNVSSDNTAFRRSLLNSFTHFIIRIRDSLLYYIKNKSSHDPKLIHCFSFFDWLHTFLVMNMNKKSNFQRKITTLELLKIILTYFGEPRNIKEKLYTRKSNKDNLSLKYYSSHFSWDYKFESKPIINILLDTLHDEDNNIRSSSAAILMTYFKMLDDDFDQLEELFKTGISLTLSQLFYTAESGALVIKVLITLAYNSPSDRLKKTIFSRSGSVLSLLLNSAEDQFDRQQKDLLKSAAQGSFLYGTLHALQLLLGDPDSPEYMLLDGNHLERLLCLIENVTKYFIDVLSSNSSSSSEYAPSFGEMGMAIAHVVEYSSLREAEVVPTDSDDAAGDLQLTPAQQLVLSCVWLNLKECCKLSSSLVSRGLIVTDTERCVSLVVNVLRRCRHKGAIESAGLALYHITRHITTSGTHDLMDLPTKLLEGFLQSLADSTAATVSRRSAGLAILVHKLITGDSRPKKPLLHVCVSRLLPIVSDLTVTEEALVDLPQSQALHFLRTLVLESSLREHMAQYTLDISMVALTNLASPIWTIRNAALQLFGSLVPKLVGQKPHQEEGKGSHFLVFEELYFHAKLLVDVMMSEFAATASSSAIDIHSKIMPLLTLVTNLTTGLHCIISQETKKVVCEFQKYFLMLFKSNIYNVRKLSAKAHSLLLQSSEIAPTIQKRIKEVLEFSNGHASSIESENELHGYLINLKELLNRFSEEKLGMKALLLQTECCHKKLTLLSHTILSQKHSYFVKSVIFDLASYYTNLDLNNGRALIKYSGNYVGLPNFLGKQLNCILLNSNEDELNKIVHNCLFDGYNIDFQLTCLQGLKKLMKSRDSQRNNDGNYNLLLFNTLKDYVLRNAHTSELLAHTYEVMLIILESHYTRIGFLAITPKIHCPKFVSYCLENLFSNKISISVFQFLLPVTCGVLSSREVTDFKDVCNVADIIKNRSSPDFDQDMRIHAAKSLIFLIPILKQEIVKTSICGNLVWEACLVLLQDEVVEVRFEASRFVSAFFFLGREVHNTFLSLESLFQYAYITQLMIPEKALECLWEKITTNSQRKDIGNIISNPFDHGIKSIYAEENIISHLSYCSILELIKFHRDILLDKTKAKCEAFRNEDICYLGPKNLVEELYKCCISC